MPKVTKKNQFIARKFFAPAILKLLGNYSAAELAQAVRDDVDLVELLNENSDVLLNLRRLVSFIPHSEAIAPYFRSRPWLRWFVYNELAHERRDLYAQFVYVPSTFEWLLRNMRKLSKFLFE